jgi:hypothetical protein
MVSTRRDQSIVFLGRSGAGKTTNFRHVLHYLALATPSSNSLLTGQLLLDAGQLLLDVGQVLLDVGQVLLDVGQVLLGGCSISEHRSADTLILKAHMR